MDHSWDDGSVTARLFPLPCRDIREWLAARRCEGHIARALTPMATYTIDLFSNVRLLPGTMPLYCQGDITYAFADRNVALLFKLTFGGDVPKAAYP
jgi:hypothetical protein